MDKSQNHQSALFVIVVLLALGVGFGIGYQVGYDNGGESMHAMMHSDTNMGGMHMDHGASDTSVSDAMKKLDGQN